jgi:periplasmic protein TonB
MKNIFLLIIFILFILNTLSSQANYASLQNALKSYSYKDLVYTTYDAKGNIANTVEVRGDLVQVKDFSTSTTPTDWYFYDKNTFFQYNNTAKQWEKKDITGNEDYLSKIDQLKGLSLPFVGVERFFGKQPDTLENGTRYNVYLLVSNAKDSYVFWVNPVNNALHKQFASFYGCQTLFIRNYRYNTGLSLQKPKTKNAYNPEERGSEDKWGDDVSGTTNLAPPPPPTSKPVFLGGDINKYLNAQPNTLSPYLPLDDNKATKVTFTVGIDGKLSNISAEGACHCAESEAIRLIQLTSGQWKPAQNNDIAVATVVKLDVFFAQSATEKIMVKGITPQGETGKIDTDKIYETSDVQKIPEFPGGEAAMQTYLRDNIKYPEDAKKAGIQGTVALSFVVEKNGAISRIKILKDPGGGIGLEAVRVIKAMPRWQPGEIENVPVRVTFVLPLRFRL